MPRAIVTGSESGIGRAAAVALARDGFDVGVTWHADQARGEATAQEARSHGVQTALAELDLGDAAGAVATVEALAEQLGGLDAFVSCAAIGGAGPVLETSLEDWRRVIEVNLTGTFAVAQAAARRMVRTGNAGRIVLVTSVHEHVPLGGATAYAASKGGLGLLVKQMALELASHDVLVNAVAPGEIATAMTGAEDVDPHTIERPMIPAGRPGDAREVASVIAFLCGPGAAYVTGQSYVVDGGLLLTGAEANRRSW